MMDIEEAFFTIHEHYMMKLGLFDTGHNDPLVRIAH